MPITAVDEITPLSSAWTHQYVVSTVRAALSEEDNEKLQDSNIRNYINLGISHIAELLNMAEEPWYGVDWAFTLESSPHRSGLEWCNLATPVAPSAGIAPSRSAQVVPSLTTVVPANLLRRVTAITTYSAGDLAWTGNITHKSMQELTTLNNGNNNQWRQSIAYHHHGSAVFLFLGSEVSSGDYYEKPEAFVLWGYRKPLLDNLLPTITAGSSWTDLVDLPDSHMELLLLKVKERAYEQLNKQLDPKTSQDIQNLTMQITRQLQEGVQYESQERQKARMGLQGR